jgi:FkbM family methyltransferase
MAQVTSGAATQTLTLNDEGWMKLRSQLVRQIDVDDGQFRYRFRCETPYEVWRARTLLEKEEGTVRWIRGSVRPGEVFYDIGANIGLYTLLAGKRVGEHGMVYAFEPHVANVQSLLHNVSQNSLADHVKVMSCALGAEEGFFDFNYYATQAGTSMSQLGDNRDSNDQQFQPVFAEYKYAATIDGLIAQGSIRPADHIKIDVDGNELLIVRGMSNLLTGPNPPKTLQVEINPRHKQQLYQFMNELGYLLAEKHFTMSGKKQIAAGHDPESVGYNAVFRKAA